MERRRIGIDEAVFVDRHVDELIESPIAVDGRGDESRGAGPLDSISSLMFADT